MATNLSTTNHALVGMPTRQASLVQPKPVLRGWLIVPTIFVGMVSLIVGTMTLCRLTVVTVMVEPPPQYLPGNPIPTFPENIHCLPSRFDIEVPCNIDYDGKRIVMNFSTSKREIVHTTVWNHGYRVGDMILAWGTPSGYYQSGKLVYVYWGTRTVFVYGKGLHPSSFVQTIEYLAEPIRSVRWRGFTNRSSRT